MNLSGAEKRFLQAAIIINALCLGLFLLRYLITGTPRYWFIPENILKENKFFNKSIYLIVQSFKH